MEALIKELARFLGITFEEARQRVKSYSALQMGADWKRARPKTVEQVRKFYENTDKYLYELIPWNYTPEFEKRIHPLLHYRHRKILEIGGGIGSLCIALALAGNDVTYFDINLKCREFARQRFADRLLNIKIVDSLTGLRDYDIVIAIDTLEHIHIDELPKLLKEIESLLKDDGFLYERSNFGQQEVFPMHYDHSHELPQLAEDAGLNKRVNGDYVKAGKCYGVQLALITLGNRNHVGLTSSLVNMEAPNDTTLAVCNDFPADAARQRIVKDLKKDWVFFMDSDQTFPPEALKRLMSWNQPIVSGLVFKRTGEPIPLIYRYAYEADIGHLYKPMTMEVGEYLERHKEYLGNNTAVVGPPYALLECDGIGLGCCLIHRRVFEALEPPYFKWDDGATAGEDFYFCRKVQEAGFKIMADPSVICGHYYEYIRSWQHFMRWANKEPFPYSEKMDKITEILPVPGVGTIVTQEGKPVVKTPSS